ncbi:MAG: hypothetical protein WBC44_05675 [Planctomycetaceae bacterium]
MSREAFWSMILLIGGGLALAVVQVARLGEAGTVYSRDVEKSAMIPASEDEPERMIEWTIAQHVEPRERNAPGVSLNVPRTVGLWIAAVLTLAVFSFLAGDNPVYKLAESVFVGVSAGYAMVVGFWDELVQNLFGKLLPETTQRLGLANLGVATEELEPLVYLVPLVMGVMMLWQLAPKGGWIARWPLAFFIGATAGIKMTAYFESDFLRQIQETLLPLVVIVYEGTTREVNWSETIQASLKNTAIVVGVLASLTYFFFSVEHTGPVKPVTRLGIYVLMITFGAGFAYTVMGRIALLVERFEFLFVDWLWLIDPLGVRG